MDKPRKPTLLDVAREAGVSYQTVSRVINSHPSVAEATRERVLEVIARLNYRPSKVARSLASQHSKSIAVIVYGMQHYGPTQMVINIEQAAKSADYDLIFANINPENDEDVTTTIENIERWSIDGLLLIAPVDSNRYEKLVKQFQPLPLVQIDITPGADVPSVIINQRQGSYEITSYLCQCGHKRICEIRGPMNWYGAVARHEGFLKALHACEIEPAGIADGDWTPESGYNCARQLLSQYQFTGLVVANDQMALGAMRAIHEAGLCIPDDISVVGFDDIPESNYFSPPLTTVRQDFSELGRQGVAHLLTIIENPEQHVGQHVLAPTLIIRSSVSSVMD
ncbi:MAG: LacI family transcriptional regulator [Anaerolineae bacterium]|nr:LacI family transcriptional regulator [Anaerolineae bacterium]